MLKTVHILPNLVTGLKALALTKAPRNKSGIIFVDAAIWICFESIIYKPTYTRSPLRNADIMIHQIESSASFLQLQCLKKNGSILFRDLATGLYRPT
ncbi:hypothetical protein TNIN_278491, partial [Trichonephila inaurata madagascariensis]